MLLLKAFLGSHADKEALREYQRDRWGMRADETCVIELFGLPAPTVKAFEALMHKLFSDEETDKILQTRIDFLRGMIKERAPALVVMYGYSAGEQWEKIVRQPIVRDKPFKIEFTTVIWTKHPTAPNPEGDAYWKRLGVYCAEFANR